MASQLSGERPRAFDRRNAISGLIPLTPLSTRLKEEAETPSFEASARQATPGKMLFGIFVTDLQGRRISWRAGLGRGIGRLLSAVICFIGYFVALLSPRNQALHDMLASTLVLEPSGTPPPASEVPR